MAFLFIEGAFAGYGFEGCFVGDSGSDWGFAFSWCFVACFFMEGVGVEMWIILHNKYYKYKQNHRG